MVDGGDSAYDDAVAIGGWPFDNHTSGGFDDPETPPSESLRISEVYNIPLRVLYSANVNNLFMAGRNISATHVAFTSTRVMGTCAVEGQAIGTATAFCLKNNLLPQQLYEDKPLFTTYQQQLLRDDQTIKGVVNEDPGDLARSAKVRASGEVDGSKAANVINGLVRNTKDEWGNRWGGSMTENGAWLELEWDVPQQISHVQFCFDTAFDRQLTISAELYARKNQIRGRQPETVCDYRLLCKESPAGAWKEIASVTGNYQRLRRHDFDVVTACSLRMEITATNGSPEARLYEIRCYA